MLSRHIAAISPHLCIYVLVVVVVVVYPSTPASQCMKSVTRLFQQEGVKTENDHINLKVAGQDGSVVQFKIKRHTPLSKLMKAYCERQVTSQSHRHT